MEPTSNVRLVSPRKAPRKGHVEVVAAATELRRGVLPIQLPTGYGKTYAAAAVFRALFDAGEVDRVLYLVPTTAQLNQFANDGREDFLDAGVYGVVPFDISYSPTQAMKAHRDGSRVVFVATIQAVASGSAGLAVREMMLTGRWLVVVDEHHHYGIHKTWGRAVLDMRAAFTLAMSATPDRKAQDSAFGAPVVRVSYVDAREQKAVKSIELHAYEYRVDAITVNGEPRSFSTSELAEAAGSADPQAIDKFIVNNKLRWSPKYISPLVSIPVERLLARRGGYPLQMIVGAMGCLHAKMVCEQIRSMFGDLLAVDWVGTGPSGRSDAENEAVIKRFCPPKVDGARRPQDVKLDVLVHVGMAGEGLDSVFVAEVVHLNAATITNQNDQENGRSARRIPGAPEKLQKAFINVDTSSEYAAWSGDRIERVFDRDNGDVAPAPDTAKPDDEGDGDDRDIPAEPHIMIADCRLENIDKGDPEVKGCAEALVRAGNFDPLILSDPNHQIWDAAVMLRHRELVERARNQEGMSVLYQLRHDLKGAVGSAASTASRAASSGRFERSLVGDMCKRINSEMCRRFGQKVDDASEPGLRERRAWVRQLQIAIRSEGLPPWLR